MLSQSLCSYTLQDCVIHKEKARDVTASGDSQQLQQKTRSVTSSAVSHYDVIAPLALLDSPRGGGVSGGAGGSGAGVYAERASEYERVVSDSQRETMLYEHGPAFNGDNKGTSTNYGQCL